MRRFILTLIGIGVLAIAIGTIVFLRAVPSVTAQGPDEGNTPSYFRAGEHVATYRDIHKTDPPHEFGEVSPTTLERAKKAVNWPGNLGEQYQLEGNVSLKGLTRAERTGRVTPPDARH
jgi:hypothetical protein